MADYLQTRVADGVGYLTLTRQRALNALNFALVTALTDALTRWRTDPEVAVVVLASDNERALCAGGDLRELYGLLSRGELERIRSFFWHEYRLDAMIASYPKPVVAIMDGITMGGGVGIAGHADVRVVTEWSRIAMPETRIGFAPDAGGSWLLARAPGETGLYLGLNSEEMDAADALYAGFADVFVPRERLSALLQVLAERAGSCDPAEIALLFTESPPPSKLARLRSWIDACYSAPTVPEIVARLRAIPEDAPHRTADELLALSPTAVAITLAAIRCARRMPQLEDVLEQEFYLGTWFAGHPDFQEGVRALIIDKDSKPAWHPATLAELPPDLGERVLAAAGSSQALFLSVMRSDEGD
ncbi:MAG: 3-hydroxyisobutyryl-CoA hydrolase [Candidatus Lumbricidophila eiseniae]|uniref:3-hydroxyisobutyryl-CoA hydrolase n=1 Tax=Candidatus Lumbricidiphila eiseniae TaxID=1969409 RepID=A0A2A6FTS9_9MICO|nr:MAG: 3-hydroxyisobutyryl-CoA hydrolase [Candidatus Lumbricidophila eiseniae]